MSAANVGAGFGYLGYGYLGYKLKYSKIGYKLRTPWYTDIPVSMDCDKLKAVSF